MCGARLLGGGATAAGTRWWRGRDVRRPGLLAFVALVVAAVAVVAPVAAPGGVGLEAFGPGGIVPSGTQGDGRADPVELPSPGDVDQGDAGRPGVACPSSWPCAVWRLALATPNAEVRVVADSVVIASDGGLAVHAATTGERRWDRTGGPGSVRSSAVLDDLGLLLATTDDGTLLALDLATGAERFSVAAGVGTHLVAAAVVRPSRPSSAGPTVQVVLEVGDGAHAHRLLSLDPGTGRPSEVTTGEQLVLTPAGPVVVAAREAVRGIDPDDGTVRWELPLYRRPISVHAVGDRVVVVGWDAAAVLDAATGERVVTAPISVMFGQIERPQGMLVSAGSTVTFVGTGGEVWSARIVPGGCCRGAAFDPETVTVLLSGGELVVLDRVDGTLRGVSRAGVGADGPERGSVLHDGSVLVRPTSSGSGREPSRVRDAVSGDALAILPLGTRVVGSTPTDALVVVAGDEVVAVAPAAEQGGARDRVGSTRRCSSRAPAGCRFGG